MICATTTRRGPMPPDPRTLRRHLRNRHGPRYDFPALLQRCPEFALHVITHPRSGDTIDFANPESVLALNRALLMTYYQIDFWDLPSGYLCPPIPGRSEYIHHVADLLTGADKRAIPRGPGVVVLDIGVGANCVYPIIGVAEYGWRFVGTDIDPVAVAWANKLVAANRILAGNVSCRLQSAPQHIFAGVVVPGESFAVAICNPPFHASASEAEAGTLRKLRNLGDGTADKAVLNFGGQNTELWCDGGELGFIQRMITESAARPATCRWYTSMVSKQGNLPAILRALKTARVADTRVIEMNYGQKKSRIVAWTFAAHATRT